jgi:hypothetical protein
MSAAIRRLHSAPSERRQLADNSRVAGLVYDRRAAVDAYRRVFEELI